MAIPGRTVKFTGLISGLSSEIWIDKNSPFATGDATEFILSLRSDTISIINIKRIFKTTTRARAINYFIIYKPMYLCGRVGYYKI